MYALKLLAALTVSVAALSMSSATAQNVDRSAGAELGLVAYEEAAFRKMQAQGNSMLITISASWCPVCRVHENTIKRLIAPKPEFANVHFLRVDFDAQKPVVTKFNASSQSTLIAIKNGKEVGRMVGSTDTGKIVNFAKTHLQ